MNQREEIARTLARLDWPLASAPEQNVWIENHWRDHLSKADAILSLSLSDGWREIVERCAKVAEEYGVRSGYMDSGIIADEIAAAIRALSSPPPAAEK